MVDIMNLPGKERTFAETDIIVSKTNEKGILTYANDVFLEIADYTEAEVLGKPHSLIRHPAMPRCIFKLLWTTIANDEELFAYVLNKTKHGDYYWVLAHVTPTHGPDGSIIGYHSNRRIPNREALEVIRPLYKRLKEVEDSAPTVKEGIEEAFKIFNELMREQGMRYDMFMYRLQQMETGGLSK
jgi:PAS domain S-box-containing protein